MSLGTFCKLGIYMFFHGNIEDFFYLGSLGIVPWIQGVKSLFFSFPQGFGKLIDSPFLQLFKDISYENSNK